MFLTLPSRFRNSMDALIFIFPSLFLCFLPAALSSFLLFSCPLVYFACLCQFVLSSSFLLSFSLTPSSCLSILFFHLCSSVFLSSSLLLLSVHAFLFFHDFFYISLLLPGIIVIIFCACVLTVAVAVVMRRFMSVCPLCLFSLSPSLYHCLSVATRRLSVRFPVPPSIRCVCVRPVWLAVRSLCVFQKLVRPLSNCCFGCYLATATIGLL